MSTTPRTDAELETRGCVDEYLCRDLERECTALKEELRQTRENLYHDLDRNRDDITTPHLAVVAGNTIAALRKDVAATNAALEGLRRHAEELGAVQMKLEAAKELRDETIAELVSNNGRLTAALTELREAARVYKQHLSAQAVLRVCDEALGEPVAVEDRPMPGVEP